MMTTDPQDEIFPHVNEKDEVIGQVLRKEANHNPAIIHRAIGILVYNQKKELLIQKRSATKDTYPNAWTISVTGHVDYGVSYDDTVVREMSEEVGVESTVEDFTCLGKILVRASYETEFWQVYEYHLNNNITLKRNEEEIAEIQFVSLSVLKQMLTDSTIEWTIGARDVFKGFL
ncbi:hypothetical protein BH09PAT2_BH09PAT2_10330 [soil metagenome]